MRRRREFEKLDDQIRKNKGISNISLSQRYVNRPGARKDLYRKNV
jgi:hypothetical protein